MRRRLLAALALATSLAGCCATCTTTGAPPVGRGIEPQLGGGADSAGATGSGSPGTPGTSGGTR